MKECLNRLLLLLSPETIPFNFELLHLAQIELDNNLLNHSEIWNFLNNMMLILHITETNFGRKFPWKQY